MIDINSITYPNGVKRYLRNNESAQDIIRYMYDHAEPVTCKSLCSALNLPSKPTTTILTNLCGYGVIKRANFRERKTAPVYSYSLNGNYRVSLKDAAEKQQASAEAGGAAA